MVRLVERKRKVREWKRVKERNEKKEEGLGRGGWMQDSINCDGGQKTEEWMCWCDLSLPLL